MRQTFRLYSSLFLSFIQRLPRNCCWQLRWPKRALFSDSLHFEPRVPLRLAERHVLRRIDEVCVNSHKRKLWAKSLVQFRFENPEFTDWAAAVGGSGRPEARQLRSAKKTGKIGVVNILTYPHCCQSCPDCKLHDVAGKGGKETQIYTGLATQGNSMRSLTPLTQRLLGMGSWLVFCCPASPPRSHAHHS